jgi:hypothetical protein
MFGYLLSKLMYKQYDKEILENMLRLLKNNSIGISVLSRDKEKTKITLSEVKK